MPDDDHHCHYVQCTYCCSYKHHQQLVLKSHHSFRSTKLCSHTIITQNSVTFQLLKQEPKVTFLKCLMSFKNYSKHQARFVQQLNSLIKEQQSRNVCILPEGWGARHLVQGCKLQTLDSLFPRIDFLVQYYLFQESNRAWLQRAWSLLEAQAFNNDDDDENNNNNN